MILSPVQNTAYLNKSFWFQKRSRKFISQKFGNKLYINSKNVYAQWDMLGHNGIDYALPIGTPIFAPFSGEIRVINEGSAGYGLHIKLRSKEKALEACLGHLFRSVYRSGDNVTQGDIIGWSGNSGFSTGPHLHFGLRKLKSSNKDLFVWSVLDYSNGYKGYINQSQFCIEWKGTHDKNNL